MSSIADLALVGGGSLARAVCCSLAVAAPFPLRINVCARDPRKAVEVVYLCAARARLSGYTRGLDLRSGLDEAKAVEFNQRAADSEGVVVLAGAVTFEDKAARLLSPRAWAPRWVRAR